MDCISQIWSLDLVVNRLVKLTVKLKSNTDAGKYDWDDGNDEEFTTTRNFISFIPKLCERSSLIRHLTVDFDANEGDLIQMISIQNLQLLAKPPLEVLDLRHAAVEKTSQACQVLSQCRSLRELHLQDQRFQFDDVLQFSRLSSVECFHAEIYWGNISLLQKFINNPPQPPSTLRVWQFSNPPHLEHH
ncbi:hypothetical protein RhiLY_08778 [Ceratobasidium sp. AG-Ba]|nr:hypothetical protein RhiLY_08778 [Ceratobasidium sp. AG-Ba]